MGKRGYGDRLELLKIVARWPKVTMMSTLSLELASAGLPFVRIPEFIHRLEDSYNPILMSQFQAAPDLLEIVVNLDEFLHKVLEVLAESYFNSVRPLSGPGWRPMSRVWTWE